MILKNKLKKIIEAIENTDIKTIEISSFWGAQKIKLSKNSKAEYIHVEKQGNVSEEPLNNSNAEPNQVSDMPDNNSTNVSVQEDVPVDGSIIQIKAPLVGTFYLSPKPGEPPFVNVGDKISEGHSICIVEAMKIFNEIESEHSGEIIDILVKDGDPVEFDQVLFALKPE